MVLNRQTFKYLGALIIIMEFKEKYARESEALLAENKDKIPISNDAYARCEMIAELIKKIEHVRVDLK